MSDDFSINYPIKNNSEAKVQAFEINSKEKKDNCIFPEGYFKDNSILPCDNTRVTKPYLPFLRPELEPIPKPPKLSKNSDIKTDYEWSIEDFNIVLNRMLNNKRYGGKFKNSVLQNKGEAFIKAGKQFGIDPRIIVAVAMQESGRGISKQATELNNVGGLIINGKYHNFESVDKSILSIAKTLSSRYSEGYTTAQEIAYSGRYCDSTASEGWLKNVNFYLKYFD